MPRLHHLLIAPFVDFQALDLPATHEDGEAFTVLPTIVSVFIAYPAFATRLRDSTAFATRSASRPTPTTVAELIAYK